MKKKSLKTELYLFVVLIVFVLVLVAFQYYSSIIIKRTDGKLLDINLAEKEFSQLIVAEKDALSTFSGTESIREKYFKLKQRCSSCHSDVKSDILKTRESFFLQLFNIRKTSKNLIVKTDKILTELINSVKYIHEHHLAYLKNFLKRNREKSDYQGEMAAFQKKSSVSGLETEIIKVAVRIQTDLIDIYQIFYNLQTNAGTKELKKKFASEIKIFFLDIKTFESSSLDAQDGILVEELLLQGRTFQEIFNKFVSSNEQEKSLEQTLLKNREQILATISAIEKSNNNNNQSIKKNIDILQITTLIVIICIGIFMLTLWFRVIKEIENISKEARNIQNDYRYQINIGKKTFHEFRIVFETMNTMAAQINRQIDEFSESQDLLEINVRERTEELFNINEELKNKIIEKINAEKELVESNSRLSLAAEASNALVWEWNPEQSLLYLDKRSWDIIGYSGSDGSMTLEKFAELHYPEEFEVIKEKITSLLQGKSSLYINEHRVFVKNREWRWFRSYGKLVQKKKVTVHSQFANCERLQNKKGGLIKSVVGIAVDITDLKHAEERNRILEERLQQSQKMEAMGTLAGGVAHDFNNILGAITGYSQLGKLSVSKDSKTTEYLDQVLQACKRATEIVKQILTFSRQTKSEKSLCDMGSIINEALKLLRASIPSTIEIQKNIQREIGTVMVDPTQIHQVIINLCTNAYHAMKKSGGTLNLSLESVRIDNPELYDTPGLTPGEYLCLTVTDTGNGMDKDIVKKVFDPYFTTKEKEEGTGMGLAIVHGIVMDHGGAITVKSIIEKGTSFYLYFPVVDHKLTKEPGENFGELLPGTGELVYGTGKILVVDDEEIIADVTEEMLKDLGYEVLSETDSAKALEMIKKDPDNFDLVISDLIMPKITGDVLAEEIHKIRKEMPVIISTGLGKNIPSEIIEKSCAAAFLKKPFDIDELAKIVQKILST